jgi:hypothetical protein
MKSTFPRAAVLFLLSAVVPACDGGNRSSAPVGGGADSNVPPAVSILSPAMGE